MPLAQAYSRFGYTSPSDPSNGGRARTCPRSRDSFWAARAKRTPSLLLLPFFQFFRLILDGRLGKVRRQFQPRLRHLPLVLLAYRVHLHWGRFGKALDYTDQASALALAAYSRELRQLGEPIGGEEWVASTPISRNAAPARTINKIADWSIEFSFTSSGENLPKVQGLVLGCEGKKNAVSALVDSDDIHCLMIGAPGVGKTAFLPA